MEEIHFTVRSCFHIKFSKKFAAMVDVKTLSLLLLVYKQKPASTLEIKEYLEFITCCRPLSTQMTDN